jgi:PPM family protein phosphatase
VPPSGAESGEGAGNGELEGHAQLGKLSWGMRSHAGTVRAENEDFAGVHASTAPDDAWTRPPLFVVADGMGGHAAGEIASRVAVETVIRRWENGTFANAAKDLRNAVRDANLAVIDAGDRPERRGMGTTLTALALSGQVAHVAHVGDSRGYLVRAGACTQVTSDHSRAADMLKMRLITTEQAVNHPARSQLTRGLGDNPLVQIDLYRQPIERGDTWVLCSDGLWNVVGSRDIAGVVTAIGSDPALGNVGAAARRLVDLAVDRQSDDNVTALVVQVTSDRPIPPEGRPPRFRRRASSARW